ncbi:helix-turn-helix domain-containing protein (plasmid) [Rhodococcus sp. USK10]|uniref:helix-turn-helix domain-containing protein n=1 Tax=Rhodococcus sp. USK10 TaxID=2789739 RepID=UPI001C5E6DB9|nr:helix-turn-helix domain-containing protein [Rhodococcus sp. USK10]
MATDIRRHRISEVKRDLLRTSSTLMTLAEKWGYSDASHLTREFKSLEGCTRGEFRRQFAGNQASC